MKTSHLTVLLSTLVCLQLFKYTDSQASFFRVVEAQNYKISGKIIGAKDGWIYLAHAETLKSGMKIDSAKLTGGMFTFSGTVIGIEPFLIGLPTIDKNGNQLKGGIIYKGPMILSSGNLYVESGYDKPIFAQGTPAQEELNLFNNRLKVVDVKLKAIRNHLSNLKKNETKTIESLTKNYDSIAIERLDVTKSHVTEYNNSEVSAFILKTMLITADSRTLKSFKEILTIDVQNSKTGKDLLKMISEASIADVGMLAPSFTLSDNKGNLVSLDAFKGKYVLIDFWASWCGPCRENHPKLINAYKLYKGNNFEIVGISLDSKEDVWKKAIAEDKLPWIQLIDPMAAASEVGKKYGVKAIPMNFLLDPEGKIIGRNLKQNDLSEALSKIK